MDGKRVNLKGSMRFKSRVRLNTIRDNPTQDVLDDNYIRDVLIPNLDKFIVGLIALIIITIAIFNFANK